MSTQEAYVSNWRTGKQPQYVDTAEVIHRVTAALNAVRDWDWLPPRRQRNVKFFVDLIGNHPAMMLTVLVTG